MTEPIPHSDVVMEVVDFAYHGPLFRGERPPEGLGVRAIDAPPASWFGAGPGGKSSRALTKGELPFEDLLEDEAGELVRALSSGAQRRVDELFMMHDPFPLFVAIGQRLVPEHYLWAEGVYDHLLTLGRLRAAFGISERLYERMFQVYRSGGFPCGYDISPASGVVLLAVYPGELYRKPNATSRDRFIDWLEDQCGRSLGHLR